MFRRGIIFCLAILLFFAVRASNITAEQCPVWWDSWAGTLHVPCLNLENTSYWLNFKLSGTNMELVTLCDNGRPGNSPQCATFDSASGRLHIPCLNLGATSYWIDLGFESASPNILFNITSVGENSVTAAPSEIPKYPLPFKVMDNYFYYFDGKDYKKIFINGVNLGVGIPGTQAGELAAVEEQYSRWFEMMSEAGFNSLRIYTLHHPRFYKAFAEYNRNHPDKPLYLFHGVWLEEINLTGDLFDMSELFKSNLDEAIDAVHGNIIIPERLGKAYGTYDSDISPWIIGWIIGREIFPPEIKTTNEAHMIINSFSGLHLKITTASPSEVWLTASMDYLIGYEKTRYGVERPVSVSSWPTLDPLNHPTEQSATSEDAQSIDLVNVQAQNFMAGHFISYHAYPYYPNFINEEPQYLSSIYYDEYGVNNYLGYLSSLQKHYSIKPLLIAEYGVPSSWGNVRFSPGGMHHGGHDEVMAGNYAARMLKSIKTAGCAGGIYFSWIDEWWKGNWLVNDLAFPIERRRLWHNKTNPEQNYGLIAFETGAPQFNLWKTPEGSAYIKQLSVASDAMFFYVRLETKGSVAETFPLVIGFDTYGDSVGESVLPDGAVTNIRSEFALKLNSDENAELMVAQAYDLYGLWFYKNVNNYSLAPSQLFHSIATDGAPWNLVRWKNGGEHISADGQYYFPSRTFEIGKLHIKKADSKTGSMDAILIDDHSIIVRMPWTMLQFTDPSALSVFDDKLETTSAVEASATNGIRIVVSIMGEQITTERYVWDPWDSAPLVCEKDKDSLKVFSDFIKTLQ